MSTATEQTPSSGTEADTDQELNYDDYTHDLVKSRDVVYDVVV